MEKVPQGYFLLSRLIFESPIWRECPRMLKLFIYLIGVARHKKVPKRYPGFAVKRGELVTSLWQLSEDNEYLDKGRLKKLSRQSVSRMLKRLQNLGMIELKADTYGTHICICNYEKYQSPESYKADTFDTGVEIDWNQSGTRVETNNKDNNGKNDNESGNLPFISELRNYFINVYGGHVRIPDSFKSWDNDLRLLVEKDKRPIDEIREVITFAAAEFSRYKEGVEHSFRVESPRSLRDKYEKLLAKLTRESNKNKKPTYEFI